MTPGVSSLLTHILGLWMQLFFSQRCSFRVTEKEEKKKESVSVTEEDVTSFYRCGSFKHAPWSFSRLQRTAVSSRCFSTNRIIWVVGACCIIYILHCEEFPR